MIHHMFVFGVIIPTIITVSVFIAFLICWFKFNMRDRFFKKHFKQQKKPSIPGQPLETVASLPVYKDLGSGPASLPNLDHGPPETPRGASIHHAHHSHSTDFPEDVCSIEDPEAALCSHAVAVDHSRYYLEALGSEAGLRKELPHISHVTQTFHFPELTKPKQVELTNDDLDNDDTGSGNYGHFIHVLDFTAAESEALMKEIQCMIHQGAPQPKVHQSGGAYFKGLNKEVVSFAQNMKLVQET